LVASASCNSNCLKSNLDSFLASLIATQESPIPAIAGTPLIINLVASKLILNYCSRQEDIALPEVSISPPATGNSVAGYLKSQTEELTKTGA